eukprot:2432836-Prymnesium_polylepis.1
MLSCSASSPSSHTGTSREGRDDTSERSCTAASSRCAYSGSTRASGCMRCPRERWTTRIESRGWSSERRACR